VALGVERDRDGRVSEALTDDLGVYALLSSRRRPANLTSGGQCDAWLASGDCLSLANGSICRTSRGISLQVLHTLPSAPSAVYPFEAGSLGHVRYMVRRRAGGRAWNAPAHRCRPRRPHVSGTCATTPRLTPGRRSSAEARRAAAWPSTVEAMRGQQTCFRSALPAPPHAVRSRAGARARAETTRSSRCPRSRRAGFR
jgi:hypothetical protein